MQALLLCHRQWKVIFIARKKYIRKPWHLEDETAEAESETGRLGIRCDRDGAKEGSEKEGIPGKVCPHDTDYLCLGDKFSAT